MSKVHSGVSDAGKRLFDFVASLSGLIVLSPALLVVAAWIKLSSPGPVFYRGVRAGYRGKPFRIYKFRSMVVNADKIGGPSTSADDPRVTRIGAFLRRYKLDELPQFINVLTGDMSFVGPRPEVLDEVSRYSDEEKHLLDVRPGITDWSSIKFRNEGEILRGAADPHAAYLEKIRPEKVRLGLQYVRERSFGTDCRILLQTVKAIFE